MIGKLFSLFNKSEEPCHNNKQLGGDSEDTKIEIPQEETLWLLLPRKHDSPDLTFFDMCNATMHKFKLPESVLGISCRCIGSCHGWLALETQQRKNDNPQISLFDPVSSHQIALPPFKDDEQFKGLIAKHVCLSISPDAASYTVAVNFDYKILAICSSESDMGWNIFQDLLDDHHRVSFDRILFSSDSKTLYASLMCEDGCEVPPRVVQTRHISLAGRQDDIVLKLLPDYSHLRYPRVKHEGKKGETRVIPGGVVVSYLVEPSHAEVLIVYRVSDYWTTSNWDDNDEDNVDYANYFQNKKFEVMRINLAAEFEVPIVTTLTDLGDQALFVSQGQPFLVSTANYNNGFESNCVYFLDALDSAWLDDYEYQRFCRESGVYYIKDEKIRRFLPSYDVEKECPMIWFSPNLNKRYNIKLVGP